MKRKKVYVSRPVIDGAERIRESFVLTATEETQPRHAARCAKNHRWITAARRDRLHWRARLLNQDGSLFRPPWEYDTDKIKLAQADCPQCHGLPVAKKAIVGKFNPKVKCDDRCLNAKSDDCSCSCGGVNHGMGHSIEFESEPLNVTTAT